MRKPQPLGEWLTRKKGKPFMNWEERKHEALKRAENKMKWSPKRLKIFRLLGGWSQNEFSASRSRGIEANSRTK